MTMSLMFEKIGAPLNNIVWSWGSTTEDNKKVYLRVWQNETKIINGKRCVHILARSMFEGKKNLGYEERLKQIELVKNGAECFVIFCEPRKPLTVPRKVVDYVKDRVFPGGSFVEYDGDLWIEYGVGIPLSLHLSNLQAVTVIPAA